MEAKVENVNGVVVVRLKGQLNYETADPFRAQCLENFLGKKVIFDFQELSFVGSSGITTFVQAIQELARHNGRNIKLCKVASEFRRIIETEDISTLEFYEDVDQAWQSLQYQYSDMPRFLEDDDLL